MSTILRSLFLILGLVSATASAADESFDTLRTTLADKFPNLEAEDIYESPLPGVVEVRQGAVVAYLSVDGRYLIRGTVIDIEENRNLTEDSAALSRAEIMSSFDGAGVTFAPDDPKHTVTVFTDVDCGWCRELHKQIEAYNDLGIAVRYLMWPRGGPNTDSWRKAEQVWCAADQQQALTRAKNDQSLPAAPADCDATVVRKHFETGLEIGVSGTPAIVTNDGLYIGGYKSAPELAAILEQSQTVSETR